MPPTSRSRYLFSRGIRDASGRLLLTTPDPFRYVQLADNAFHEVETGDTFHALAERYWPNVPDAADLWWIIPPFQPEPIHDPTRALTPGRMLVIPSERTVLERIFDPARAQTSVDT